EQHHAQLGDMEDRLRVGDEPQTERSDGEPGREIAEHRAQARTLEQRHGNDAGSQQRHDLQEVDAARRRRDDVCSVDDCVPRHAGPLSKALRHAVRLSAGQGAGAAAAFRGARRGLATASALATLASTASGASAILAVAMTSASATSTAALASSLRATILGRFCVVGKMCMIIDWRTSSDGTAMKPPIGPQTQSQKAMDTKMMKGLRVSALPTRCGKTIWSAVRLIAA